MYWNQQFKTDEIIYAIKNGENKYTQYELKQIENSLQSWYTLGNLYSSFIESISEDGDKDKQLTKFFNFLFAFKNQAINNSIAYSVNRKMYHAVRWSEKNANIEFDKIDQVSAAKIFYTMKAPSRKEKINLAKMLAELYYVNRSNKIIKYFTPEVYSSTNELVTTIYTAASSSAHMFANAMVMLNIASEKNKKTIYDKIKNLILKRKISYNNAPILVAALKDEWILNQVKNDFDDSMRSRIVLYLNKMGYKNLENEDFLLCKNLLKLSPDMVDEIQKSYIGSIMGRRVGFCGTNKVKITKFLTQIPGTNPKQAFLQIHNSNKKLDTTFLYKKFPELKKLAVLV